MRLDSYQDIAKDSWIGSWPYLLRCILFLPLALGGAILVPMLFLFVISFSADIQSGTLDGGWYRIVQSAIMGGLFVFIGAYIVPNFQFLIGIILLVLLAVILTFLTTSALFLHIESVWYQILHTCVALGGGAAALYAIYEASR